MTNVANQRASGRTLSKTTPLYHWPLMVLSDIHLGKKSCAADMLYEFLERATCDTLILNGDIMDGWVLMKKNHRKLPEMQKRVMDLINARIADGMKVIYIPGNHDENLRKRKLFGKDFYGIHFADSVVYNDRRGRRFFILHGDQFDPQILKDKGRVLYHLGDAAYDGLIELNAVVSKAAQSLLSRRFSIAAYAKKKTKKLLGIINKFEDVVAHSAKKEKVDGIICGHIHQAEFENKGKVLYGNSGDWVESCTALVCDDKGDWSVMRWLDERERLGLRAAPDPQAHNPYESFRTTTERMLRMCQRIWPSRDRAELMARVREGRAQVTHAYEKIQRNRVALTL